MQTHQIVGLSLTILLACTGCRLQADRKSSRAGGTKNETKPLVEDKGKGKGTRSINESFTRIELSPGLLAGPRRMRLLSSAELRYTVADLFGIEYLDTSVLGNRISKHLLFDHIGEEHPIHLDQLKSYLSIAESLALKVDLNEFAPCNNAAYGNLDLALSCLQQFLQTTGSKIWRRPLTTDEESRLQSLFVDTFEQHRGSGYGIATRTVLSAMLFSPNFLYRFELGQPVNDTHYKLTDWEIAASMSYLVWRSLPDERLWQLAEQGELSNPSTRGDELERMLKDPRAQRAIGDFATFWTRAYKVLSAPKDSSLFPEFTPDLRLLLSQETSEFYRYIFFNEDSQLATFEELLTAPYTVGGQKLATYYESDSVSQKIPLDGGDRIGVLGHGGLLAGYSYADSSSPVHRGVFVLENILCRAFPEPPAVTVPEAEAGKSNRDRFKAHSENPNCSGCHKPIDGVGFGLEAFDSIGQYKAQADQTEGEVVLDGQKMTFFSVNELAQNIANSEDGMECHAKQWYRYAFGQKETMDSEKQFIGHLTESFVDGGGQLRSLLNEIVENDFFIYRINRL